MKTEGLAIQPGQSQPELQEGTWIQDLNFPIEFEETEYFAYELQALIECDWVPPLNKLQFICWAFISVCVRALSPPCL